MKRYINISFTYYLQSKYPLLYISRVLKPSSHISKILQEKKTNQYVIFAELKIRFDFGVLNINNEYFLNFFRLDDNLLTDIGILKGFFFLNFFFF